MGQRIRSKKNRATAKGVAIRRTNNGSGNNTIRIGNVTIRNNGNAGNSRKRKKKVAVRRKKT